MNWKSFTPDPLRAIGSVTSVYARWFREFPPRASLRKAYAARLNIATSSENAVPLARVFENDTSAREVRFLL